MDNSVIPGLGKLRPEDYNEFQTYLGCCVKPCLH